jgi:hypothetical protein
MAEPTDLILPMLPEMRAENAALHEQTRTMIAALDRRLGVVEKRQDSFRSALTADSLLSKLVTGDFEERIEAIKRRLYELEHQK